MLGGATCKPTPTQLSGLVYIDLCDEPVWLLLTNMEIDRLNMKYKLTLHSFMLAALLFGTPGIAKASESDPWTYAYIPLADSATLISDKLGDLIQTVIDKTNSRYSNSLPPEDTELEFRFFTEFRSSHIRDVAWGVFERCIGTNSCPGWPQFERIQMYPEESVYHEGNWRYIPSRFHLASIIKVCGIRMGADKITHLFDDGFHYFNAIRSKRKNYDLEDIKNLSLAFERSYMGTRLTGIFSYADVEANLAGVQFYRDFFGGPTPMIRRNANGFLTLMRSPDICDYVSDQFDERNLPNDYTYSLIKTAKARNRSLGLIKIIEQRENQSEARALKLNQQELAIQTESILARRIPMTRWQTDFPKLRLLGHATGYMTQFMFDPDFRRASIIFGFNPLKPGNLNDRKPIVMQRVGINPDGPSRLEI